MAIDTNIGPYYDDFNEFKNYHQMLFKPGYAVQARELTQIQSMLRNQIAKFGNHIFKHGSVVIPGNTFAELNVPCIKLEPLSPAGAGVVVSAFANKTIVGATSGVKAIVKKAVIATPTTPNTLYLSYVSGGGSNGKTSFDVAEEVYIEDTPTVRAIVNANSAGSIAYVNEGVYYINGTFVSIEKQSVVIEAYNISPSARVLLKITEEIVTSNDDDTLLDPSQGSYNFAAPGADRLKVSLTLVTLPLATEPNDDYVELMRYNAGVLEEHSRYPKYSELEKSLARRTYDESGDYIVEGYDTIVREHKRTAGNNGAFVDGDSSKLVYDVAAGRGYINGFEVESLAGQRLIVDKARTASHLKQDSISRVATYGQYMMVTDLRGTFNVESKVAVDLYDVATSNTGTKIGTAQVLALDLHAGDGVETNSIYKVYLFNIKLTSKSIDDVGSIRVTGSSTNWAKVVSEYNVQLTSGTFVAGNVVNFNAGVRTGTVAFYSPQTYKLFLYKHSNTVSLPILGDSIAVSTTGAAVVTAKSVLVSVGQNSMIFKLPQKATAALKNSSGTFDLEHTVYKKLTIPAGQSLSDTITGGTIVPLEAGNLIAVNADGMIPYSCFSLNSAYQIIITGTASGITGAPGSYVAAAGKPITLYVQVKKTAATPRTKTLVTNQQMLAVTPAASITLAHKDVIEITSIISNGVNVTNRYSLDTGQTDYSYEFSSLKLKYGYSVPTNPLTITYSYLSHSAGDFFSVDSYAGLGADYLDQIPTYVSPVDGKTYVLRDCIDYRSGTSAIVNDSILSTSVQRYLPRTDLVVLSKAGKISVINGQPSIDATAPSISKEYHVLNSIFVPAYTYSVSDVVNTRRAIKRSTMGDIKNIDQRITRLEEYTTLTALESVSLQTNVIDAKTGLTRFKTGYLTENMMNPLEIADYFNAAFAASWNNFGLIGQLQTVSIPLSLKSPTTLTTLYTNADNTPAVVNTNNGFAIHNGGVVTLAYTEEVFASQPLSSRITNINPFLVIAWNGVLRLFPNGDTWVEQVDKPEIFNTVEIVNTTTIIDPPVDPAPTPDPVATVIDAGPGTDWSTGGSNNTQWATDVPTLSESISYITLVHDGSTNGFDGHQAGDTINIPNVDLWIELFTGGNSQWSEAGRGGGSSVSA